MPNFLKTDGKTKRCCKAGTAYGKNCYLKGIDDEKKYDKEMYGQDKF